MVVHMIASEGQFQEELDKAGNKLVVVDFYATWCHPCKAIAPKIEQWSEEFTNVVFLKVDVDKSEKLAADQGINAMPTFYFFKNGVKVDEVVGASEEKIRDKILKWK